MSPINGNSYPQYWDLLLWQLLEIIVTPIRTCCMGIYQLFVPTLDNISLKRVTLPFDKSLPAGFQGQTSLNRVTHCLPLHWRIFWSTWWYLKFCIGFFSSWSLRISDYEFDVVESRFMRNSPNSSWYLNLNIGQYDNLVNQDFREGCK